MISAPMSPPSSSGWRWKGGQLSRSLVHFQKAVATAASNLLAEKLQTRSILTLHLVSFQGVRSSIGALARSNSKYHRP